MSEKNNQENMHPSNHDDGSKVHTVVLTHPRLPPVTLTYTMAGAGRMFADAHRIMRSMRSLPAPTDKKGKVE